MTTGPDPSPEKTETSRLYAHLGMDYAPADHGAEGPVAGLDPLGGATVLLGRAIRV